MMRPSLCIRSFCIGSTFRLVGFGAAALSWFGVALGEGGRAGLVFCEEFETMVKELVVDAL